MTRSEAAGTVARLQNRKPSARCSVGWLPRKSRPSGSWSRTTTPTASDVPVFRTTILSVASLWMLSVGGAWTSTVSPRACRPRGSRSAGSTNGSASTREAEGGGCPGTSLAGGNGLLSGAGTAAGALAWAVGAVLAALGRAT
jgi:hypothetical protein